MAITGNLWPGVHLQLPDSRTRRVDPLRTDVAAFLGFSSRGPLHSPVAIRSLRQYQTIFGGDFVRGFLADTVKAFFDNGGKRCWIVRIDSRSHSKAASLAIGADTNELEPLLSVSASSPGQWGNGLSVRLTRSSSSQTTGWADSQVPTDGCRLQSIVGIQIGSQVLLSQKDKQEIHVVAHIDPTGRKVRWEESWTMALNLTEPFLVEVLQFSMSVFQEGRFRGSSEKLSLHPGSDRSISRLFADPWSSSATWKKQNADASPPLIIVTLGRPLNLKDLQSFPATGQLREGADGLEFVTADDFCGNSADGSFSSKDIGDACGLQTLAGIGEVSLVSIPDLHKQPEISNATQEEVVEATEPAVCCCEPVVPNTTKVVIVRKAPGGRTFTNSEIARIQQRLLEDCERSGKRFAILDPPMDIGSGVQSGTRDILDWRMQFDSSYGALYYPWLCVSDPLRGGSRAVPPSGFVAGLAACMDLSKGVHRSPANVELTGAVGVAISYGEAEHAVLNSAGINLIRTCSSRGIRVMGARTLSSDASYRFVSVRRLLIMIKTALELSCQWAIFEPANDLTRARLKLSIDSFLEAIRKRGMLAGSEPEQAYSVVCDLENNNSELIENGGMLVEVGVAPAIPGEFILLRLGRTEHEQAFDWE